MKAQRQKLALLLAAAMTAGLVAGCGSTDSGSTSGTDAQENTSSQKQTAAEDTDSDDGEKTAEPAAAGETSGSSTSGLTDVGTKEYGWIIDGGELSEFYEEYEDGPIQQYWMSMDWEVPADGEKGKVTIDFTVPTGDSGKDYVNTLIATGEYPEVLSTSLASASVAQMYKDGMVLDLTELVDKYMPNYKKRLEESYFGVQLYNNIDGERKILQLYDLADRAQDPWCGYMYRRDWIVKYGKNEETGEAFTGGWNDDKTEWTDDVVFPSGNTDPVYISDWEWMLDIFQTALEDLGIDDDGYAFQLNYLGYTPFGDMTSGFGAVANWFLDSDGVCQYGMTSDGFRTYLECMSVWYANGWINRGFEENTSDMMFWSVDTPNVYSGRVGCFYGSQSALGSLLYNGSGEPGLEGICLMAAASPINDVYGDDSVQDIEPFMSFGTRENPVSIVMTDKLTEEDAGLLLTALDFGYSDEGALLFKRGFSDEQQAEFQNEFYIEHGLEDGAYTVLSDGTLQQNPATKTVEGLENACRMIRVPSFCYNSGIDFQNSAIQTAAVEQWTKYPNTGAITDMVTTQMSADDAQAYSDASTNIMTYVSQMAPEFITGASDISDNAVWENFCDSVNAYDPEAFCDIINDILGN